MDDDDNEICMDTGGDLECNTCGAVVPSEKWDLHLSWHSTVHMKGQVSYFPPVNFYPHTSNNYPPRRHLQRSTAH